MLRDKAGQPMVASGPRRVLAAVAVGAVIASAVPAAAAGRPVGIEIASTRADTVTGGDALVQVTGGQDVRLTLNGRDVTPSLQPAQGGRLVGLIEGFVDGRNTLVASGRPGTDRLTVVNHPMTGPVFSGPHQDPFACETAAAGLGAPLDDDCSAKTRYEWHYRSRVTQQFHQLADPYAPYPPDAATVDTGSGPVPFVVRVESSTINRSITRIAVLDDPAARGRKVAYTPSPAWNRKLVHTWGASCGTGYHQGVTAVSEVLLAGQLGKGYMTAASSLTTLVNHCNEVLSAETFMMISEHVAERYGVPSMVIGNGGSGGAIQQHTTANGYPGLLDAITVGSSFPDLLTPVTTIFDCVLLNRVYLSNPAVWTEQKRAAINGHRTAHICVDWDLIFDAPTAEDFGAINNLYDPTICHPAVPKDRIYHPVNNPMGARCTIWDSMRNIWGVDPDTGFARRPTDNVGVQYGLQALNDGIISVREFLDLNTAVGGLDIDGQPMSARTRGDAEALRIAYATGRYAGRGALDEVPIIDSNAYGDLVPVGDVHDKVRPYQMRARLDRAYGNHENQILWNTSTGGDAIAVADEWVTSVLADSAPGSLAAKVRRNRPDSAFDRCLWFAEEGSYRGDGVCDTAFQAKGSPRMAAGAPLTDDYLKCSRKPLDPADYAVEFTSAERAELAALFPDGVCDYNRPPVGWTARSQTWLSFGNETATGPVAMEPPHP